MHIDVIILCSGDGEYFAETLKSVVNQTVLPNRIYVVDNACPHDKYRNIAIAADSPLIAYVKFEERYSMTANWERCLEIGDSPYFICLHDDDLWDPPVLEEATATLTLDSSITAYLLAHASFHAGQDEYERVAAVRKRESDFAFIGNLEEPLRSFVLSTSNLGHMCALVCRRRAIGYPIQNTYMPDQGFLANHAAYGKIRIGTKVNVHIRLHPKSVTTSYSGDSRSSVELLAHIRHILIFLVENRNLRAEELAAISNDVPPAYLFRVLQACHSWPLRPALLSFGKSLLTAKPFRHRKPFDVRHYFKPWLWILFSIVADLRYFTKERRLPN